MCLQYMKLKTRNSQGLRYAYVPCGKCADCRKASQNAWKFRLNSEFLNLKKKGWNVAFCTLTYDEESLPKIPEECFADSTQYRDIACFDRASVREWIDSIRQYCKYHYKFVKGNNIRYFIASEYGSVTKRPHYHAILAWPSSLSYEKMHALCTHYWKKGFLFPRKPQGDGECLSFEVVGDATRALGYVSKYACKDIDFVDEIKGVDFYDNVKNYKEGTDERAYAQLFRNCQPFHIQSVSLGFETIKNMSDEEKREVFVNGMSFVGDGQIYRVPVYIKNKILFDNYYVYNSDGTRLVRREASQFFEKYGEEIFEEKSKFYQKYVNETTKDFLIQNGCSDVANTIGDILDNIRSKVEDVYGSSLKVDNMMGKMYMAYHNIKLSESFYQPLYNQWMMRYRRKEVNESEIEEKQLKIYSSPEIMLLRRFWTIVDMVNSYVGFSKIDDREKKDRLNKKILDYFNNVL